MKNLILTLALLVSTLTSFSQTIEIYFQDYIGVNTGVVRGYDGFIDSKNHLIVEDHVHTENKYIIDLNKKTIDRYYGDRLEVSKSIIEYEQKGDLIFIKTNDTEDATGKNIVSNVVVNTNKEDKKNPLMVLYFVSTVTNTTNGFIAKN